MDRPTDQRDLIERIHAASRPPVLLTGPAASGKTTAALGLYRQAAGALLLAPNAATTTALRRRLLADSDRGVVVAPQVTTFAALTRTILTETAGDGPGPKTLSAFRRDLLLRDVIDDLGGSDELAGLKSVIDTPRLAVALDAAIAELKRAAIEPDALAAVGGADAVTGALANVYRAYQQRLHETNTYDVEGLAWLARDRLADRARQGRTPVALDDVDAIVVDGFTDFTPTQLQILRLLAAGRQRMLITLPYVADRRRRLWHWTLRTLLALKETFGQDLAIIQAEATDATELAGLWEHLFEHGAEPVGSYDGVALVAAAGIEQEVAAAATRIKRLLAGGATPGTIAVITRSAAEYRPVVQRVFAKADIPVAGAPQALTDIPAIRYLLAAASLAPECRSETVLAVISNSYFRPQALGEFTPRTVATAKALIGEANVLAGRSAYANAVERLRRRAEYSDDCDDDEQSLAADALLRSTDALQQAGDMLEALFDLDAADLPALAEALQLTEAVCTLGDPESIARDLRALAALAAALAPLDAVPPIRRLWEALRLVPCPAARAESLVDVLDCLDARACRYDHVFLLGLTEGQFPRRFVDTPLLNERTRRRLTEGGMPIDRREDLTAREMLLFYLSASRGDRTLTLGTLQSDAGGKPCAPSAFLTALTGQADPSEVLDTETVRLGQYVPEADDLTSRADALSRAWLDLFATSQPSSATALGWAARHAPQALGQVAAGLWAADRRWRQVECDGFDGRITDDALLEALARRYPHETVFSASQLESYASCPWRFFASYVLKLSEAAGPQRHLDAPLRGKICHEILCDLLTNLATPGQPLDMTAIDDSHLAAALAESTQRVSERNRRRWAPPYPALWQVQIDRLQDQIGRYLRTRKDRVAWPGDAVHFELAFGMDRARLDDEPSDAASRPDAVAIATPAGEILLRGRIDRVDMVRAESAAGSLVVDYKTGALPSRASINLCQKVQIPLYALAAEILLGQPCIGGMYQRIGDEPKAMLCAKIKRSGKPDETYEATLAATRQAVGQYVSAMAAGQFDLLPTHDCPTFCPFREICQFTRRRRQLKEVAS